MRKSRRWSWIFPVAVVAIVVVSVVFFPDGGNALWIAAFLAPALIVLTIHSLVIGTWQRIDRRRVRKRGEAALLRGDADSLRKAAAETDQARKDWPGIDLWSLGGALEVTRRRLEGGGRPAGRA